MAGPAVGTSIFDSMHNYPGPMLLVSLTDETRFPTSAAVSPGRGLRETVEDSPLQIVPDLSGHV